MKLLDLLLESRVDYLKDKYVPLLDKKLYHNYNQIKKRIIASLPHDAYKLINKDIINNLI